MSKFENYFIISHIKKAIWNLECANKLQPGIIPEKTIEDLKLKLLELKLIKKEDD